MAAYAWARSRSLFSRLWPVIINSSSKEELEPLNSTEFGEKIIDSNKRFMTALRDGGIFLS